MVRKVQMIADYHGVVEDIGIDGDKSIEKIKRTVELAKRGRDIIIVGGSLGRSIYNNSNFPHQN